MLLLILNPRLPRKIIVIRPILRTQPILPHLTNLFDHTNLIVLLILPPMPNLRRHLRYKQHVSTEWRLGWSLGQVLLPHDATATDSNGAGLVPSVGTALFGLDGFGTATEGSFVFGYFIGDGVAGALD